MGEADLSGGLTLVFGAEGKGLRPLVRQRCDGAVSIPLAGQVESLNVCVAAAVLLYEARRQRGCLTPTLYLFDGYNLLHAGGYADVRASSSTGSRASSRRQGARGIVVFDGTGEDLERGPLVVRYAPDADTLLERLAAEHRGREQVCLVSSDSPSAARRASRCASSRRRPSCATSARPSTRNAAPHAALGAAGRRDARQAGEAAQRARKTSERKICKRACNFCKTLLCSAST